MGKRLDNTLSADELRRSQNPLLRHFAIKKHLSFKKPEAAPTKEEKFGELMRNGTALFIQGHHITRDYELTIKGQSVKGYGQAQEKGLVTEYVDALIAKVGLTDDDVEKIKEINQLQNYLINDILVQAGEKDYDPDRADGAWISAGVESSEIYIHRVGDRLMANFRILQPTVKRDVGMKELDKIMRDPSAGGTAEFSREIPYEVISSFELTAEDGPVLDKISYSVMPGAADSTPDLKEVLMSAEYDIANFPYNNPEAALAEDSDDSGCDSDDSQEKHTVLTLDEAVVASEVGKQCDEPKVVRQSWRDQVVSGMKLFAGAKRPTPWEEGGPSSGAPTCG